MNTRMKKYQIFLFYYSLIVATSLTIGTLLLTPIPQNIFLGLLFFPIALYLWISGARIQEVKISHINTPLSQAPRKSTKGHFIYASLLAIITAIISFFLLIVLKNTPDASLTTILGAQTKTATEIEKLKEEVETLREEAKQNNKALSQMRQLREETAESPVNEQPAKIASTSGYLTLKSSRWQSIDVLADKIASSKVVGQAVFGEIYELLKKEQDYYFIVLPKNVQGYIHEQFVKEVGSDNTNQ